MEFVETFEEDYPVGLLERYGGIYQQGECLHKGKRGSFYDCTIILYEYQYKAVSYIANNGERCIYNFTQLLSLGNQMIPCKNIASHVFMALLTHNRADKKDVGYFLISFITSIVLVLIPFFFLGGIFYFILFWAFRKSFACFGMCFLLWLVRGCLVKFRRAYYN